MFASFQSDSIQQWCTQLNLNVDPDALRVLTDDLNIRLREIFFDITQRTKHSGRRRTTVSDVDEALRFVRFDSSVGLGYRTSSQFVTDYETSGGKLTAINPTIDLVSAARTKVELQFQSVHADCSTKWLIIDGRPTDDGLSSLKSSKQSFGVFKPLHNAYLKQSVQALLSDNDKAAAQIITDFATNPNLAILLPSLLNSLFVGLNKLQEKSSTMLKLLASFKALLSNDYLMFSAKQTQNVCFSLLFFCLTNPVRVEDRSSFQIRAAHTLDYFLERNSNPRNNLQGKFVNALLTECLSGKCEVFFGILFSLRLLGRTDVVLENLADLMKYLNDLKNSDAALSIEIVRNCVRLELLKCTMAIIVGKKRWTTVDYDLIEEYFGSSLVPCIALVPQSELSKIRTTTFNPNYESRADQMILMMDRKVKKTTNTTDVNVKTEVQDCPENESKLPLPILDPDTFIEDASVFLQDAQPYTTDLTSTSEEKLFGTSFQGFRLKCRKPPVMPAVNAQMATIFEKYSTSVKFPTMRTRLRTPMSLAFHSANVYTIL